MKSVLRLFCQPESLCKDKRCHDDDDDVMKKQRKNMIMMMMMTMMMMMRVMVMMMMMMILIILIIHIVMMAMMMLFGQEASVLVSSQAPQKVDFTQEKVELKKYAFAAPHLRCRGATVPPGAASVGIKTFCGAAPCVSCDMLPGSGGTRPHKQFCRKASLLLVGGRACRSGGAVAVVPQQRRAQQ